jgi:hypothetical protein
VKKILIDLIFKALLFAPFFLLGLIIYDDFKRDESLKFACETMGGVYVDNRTCIEGKNLFVGK